jgi:hypothetical protein
VDKEVWECDSNGNRVSWQVKVQLRLSRDDPLKVVNAIMNNKPVIWLRISFGVIKIKGCVRIIRKTQSNRERMIAC